MRKGDDTTRPYGDDGGEKPTCAYGDLPGREGETLAYDRKSVNGEEQVREWKTGDIILDLYEVKEILGRGGFGTVYKVLHRLWNKDLAVKSLNPECALHGDYKEAFMRECLGWVNLGLHPHIVSCYYVRDIDGLPRIFSEYIDGGTLDDCIDQGSLGRWEDILELSFHCLEGLTFAHGKGIVHQDIKPQNCLLTKDRKLKITDFGIASGLSGALPIISVAPTDATLAMTMGVHGQAVGTKEYMPPEQWDHAYGEIGPWTDIYAFGSMLFQICCGELLFNDGDDPPEIVRARHLSVEPPDPASIREDIPAKLSLFILKCLKKKPADRFLNCQDAIEALLEVYKEVTGEPYHRETVKEAALLADGLNNRAVSLIDLGRKHDAMTLWEQALGLERYHPQSMYNRGIVEWHDGAITDGDLLTSLEEMRKSHTEEWLDEYLTALVHIETVNQREALKLLDIAIEAGAGEEAKGARNIASEIPDGGSGLLRTFEGPGIAYSAAFSPGGDYCLSGGNEGSLLLHEVATGKVIRSFKAHALHIQHLAFSPDGAFATSAGAEGLICRWNVQTGECINRIEIKDHSGNINRNRGEYTSAMTGDGRFVLGWNWRSLDLYDMTEGTCIKSNTRVSVGSSILALSRDGSRALLAQNKAIVVWNLDSMSPGMTFSREAFDPPGLFSSDGRFGLWCGDTSKNDYAVYLWDIEKGESIRSYRHHRSRVSFLAATEDFRYVLTGDRRNVYLLERDSGRVLRTFATEGDTGRFIALSQDDRLFLSDGASGSLHLWNIAPLFDRKISHRAPLTLSSVRTTEEITEARLMFNSLISKGREAIRNENYGSALGLAREARSLPGCRILKDALDLYWEAGLHGRKKGFSDGWQVRVFPGKAGGMFFCANTMRALSGEQPITLWDVMAGTCIKSYAVPGARLYCALWRSYDGAILVGTNEGRILAINSETGATMKNFFLPQDSFNHMVWYSDNSRLLMAGGDGVLRLWDLERSAAVITMKSPHQILYVAACSGDGKIAATGGNDDVAQWDNDNAITVWNLATGACIRAFTGHKKKVWSLALGFDGSQLYSGGGDGLVKVWNTQTGKCVHALEGHRDKVSALALTTCGEYLFSGSNDHTVRMWKVSTGECLRTFTGHSSEVTSLSLTPDGRFLLSGDYRGESRLWELEWDFEAVEKSNWDKRALPYIRAYIEHRGTDNITEQDEGSLTELEDFLKHSGMGWIQSQEVRKKAAQVSRELKARGKKPGSHAGSLTRTGSPSGSPGTTPRGTSCIVVVVIFLIMLWAFMSL